jgi:streptogramin lyase
MDTCLLCQGPLDPTTRRCQRCGHVQPAAPDASTLPASIDAAVPARTWHCSYCHAEVPQGMNFCGYCGRPPQARRCPHCHAEVPQGMNFCGYCGRSLAVPGETALGASSPTPASLPLASARASGAPLPGPAQPPYNQPAGPDPAVVGVPAMPPAPASSPLSPSGGAGPLPYPTPSASRRLSRGKRIMLVVALALVGVLNTLAAAHGLTLLRQSSSLTSTPAGPPTGTITEFPLDGVNDLSFGTNVDGITSGPDGNLWFTAAAGPSSPLIGRLTPRGALTTFPVSGVRPDDISGDVGLGGITTGSDGNLWFTTGNDQIGYITPAGKVTLLSTSINVDNGCIVAGPDGNLWFATDSDEIGRVTPGGKFTAFPLPDLTGDSTCITVGPDGDLWFTVARQPGMDADAQIGKITPRGAITLYPLPLPQFAIVWDIIKGPNGDLWFLNEAGLSDTYSIGHMIPSQNERVNSFVPFEDDQPINLTSGPDGNLWFTTNDHGIMRMTEEGILTHFSLPGTAQSPGAITVGPDGNLWFTNHDEQSGEDMIGRLTVRQA